VNGLRLKLFSFSVRGELVEPQKNTFARASPVRYFTKELSVSKIRRFIPAFRSRVVI
jgi:hypothetical protein